METALHRQLKQLYAAKEHQTEVVMHGYRIDAIGPRGELIEIQHASFGALREKTRRLLAMQKRNVRIVKPIVARKTIVTLDEPGGEVMRRRLSPKRGELLDLFLDLVHFGDVFPHPRLRLEVALIETEEIRIDRQPKRRRGKRYKSLEHTLVDVQSRVKFTKLSDLLSLLPLTDLPHPFDTAELGVALDRPRWFAQKVAYCLKQTQAVDSMGKRGHSQLYQIRPCFITVRRKNKKVA